VYIDGGVFKYTKEGAVTKKLRWAIFKKLNTVIGKELSKRAHKAWKNRTNMLNDKAVEEYRRMASSKRLQAFYRNEIKADVDEGESALSQHANTATVSNIKTDGLKGLLKIHRLENIMKDAAKKPGGQKMQLDVTMSATDSSGLNPFTFPTRTRVYVVANEAEVPEIMSKMVTELKSKRWMN